MWALVPGDNAFGCKVTPYHLGLEKAAFLIKHGRDDAQVAQARTVAVVVTVWVADFHTLQGILGLGNVLTWALA